MAGRRLATVARMELIRSNAWLTARCAGASARREGRPGVNFDRLTVVTLVIALAGFAGSTLAGL